MKSLVGKEKKLTRVLTDIGKLGIAFSGGYDSSFLAKFAEQIIGAKNVLLIHVKSVFSPSRDEEAVAKFASGSKLKIIKICANPLSVAEIARNPKDRCYHCKRVIMNLIIERGKRFGFANFADGTNYDDMFEERPGFKASNELGILHPLLEAKMRKRDMIKISTALGFDLSFSPSSACLATRIPTGTKITANSLKMADKAENLLCEFRISSPRVRVNGENAVIEIAPEHFETVLKNREEIISGFKLVGFQKALLDIFGYRKKMSN